MRIQSPLTILLIFFMGTTTLGGCSYFEHYQEVRRLQNYSASQDQKKATIKKQNRNFERLLAAAKSGQLPQKYSTQRKIMKAFGPPVIDYPEQAALPRTVWLYRYSTKFFGSDKIYLYFDLNGRLTHFQVVSGG